MALPSSSGSRPSSAVDDVYVVRSGTITVDAPGVLGNDQPEPGLAEVVVLASVQHGRLTLRADGGFDYEPDAGFSGRDAFTYQILAGGRPSGSASVVLDVRSDVDPGAFTVADEDEPLFVGLEPAGLVGFSFEWLVPGFAVAVPGVLLLVALGAQGIAAAIWLPAIYRFRRGATWRPAPRRA
jgi:hypothetical protein